MTQSIIEALQRENAELRGRVDRFRKLQRLARDSTDARAARELAEIGSELADRASSLEAKFSISEATRCC